MRILHVNDAYTERGGVEQYLLEVARLLRDHGHENFILYRQHRPDTIEQGEWPAYLVDEQSEDVLADRVQEVVSQVQPDVAYIHHVSSAAAIETVSRLVPSVAYVHGFAAVCPGLAKYYRRGDLVCERAFGWGCIPMHYLRRCSAARHPRTLARLMAQTGRLKRALQGVPRLLVGSEYMRALLERNGFLSERIAVLPPHFVSGEAAPTYVPPEDSEMVLYAGRLEIEKGFPYLLRAMRRLPVSAHLAVAGEGTLRGNYERMTVEWGLAERVRFLGWQGAQSLEALYRRCAVVAMPSICPESFGKTGVEALYWGRPVVAFAVGGIPDWLQDGVNGYLVAPRDDKGLAARIGELLANPGKAAEMGRRGQEGLLVRFKATDHVMRLLSAFAHASSEYAQDG